MILRLRVWISDLSFLSELLVKDIDPFAKYCLGDIVYASVSTKYVYISFVINGKLTLKYTLDQREKLTLI